MKRDGVRKTDPPPNFWTSEHGYERDADEDEQGVGDDYAVVVESAGRRTRG